MDFYIVLLLVFEKGSQNWKPLELSQEHFVSRAGVLLVIQTNGLIFSMIDRLTLSQAFRSLPPRSIFACERKRRC